jgi:hypothetical protein
MRLAKRTYVLPPHTVEAFEKAVAPGERSAIIGRLVQHWLEMQRRDQLRQAIVEGCRDMADVYREIEQEYHSLEEEVEHARENQPPSRRNRARTPRSGRRV